MYIWVIDRYGDVRDGWIYEIWIDMDTAQRTTPFTGEAFIFINKRHRLRESSSRSSHIQVNI